MPGVVGHLNVTPNDDCFQSLLSSFNLLRPCSVVFKASKPVRDPSVTINGRPAWLGLTEILATSSNSI